MLAIADVPRGRFLAQFSLLWTTASQPIADLGALILERLLPAQPDCENSSRGHTQVRGSAVIACIKGPAFIQRILDHLEQRAAVARDRARRRRRGVGLEIEIG